jgi:hypothetical protein
MNNLTFSITFAGVLAVELMEFDYMGKHFSYHGRKLENAVKRLTALGGPKKATVEELVIWGRACHEWKEKTGKLS